MDEDNGKKWVMPEPVFRHSTGELVAPAEDLFFDPEPDTLQPNSPEEPEVETAEFLLTEKGPVAATPPTQAEVPLSKLYDPPPKTGAPAAAPTPAPAPSVAVEPQPFVSEEFTAEKIIIPGVDSPAKQSGGSMLVVIGTLVLLGVAAGLAALVYYMFYAGRTETGF